VRLCAAANCSSAARWALPGPQYLPRSPPPAPPTLPYPAAAARLLTRPARGHLRAQLAADVRRAQAERVAPAPRGRVRRRRLRALGLLRVACGPPRRHALPRTRGAGAGPPAPPPQPPSRAHAVALTRGCARRRGAVLVRRSTCEPSTAARRAVSNRHVPCTSGAVTGNGRARNGRACGCGRMGRVPRRGALPRVPSGAARYIEWPKAREGRGARGRASGHGVGDADATARAAGVWPGRAKAGAVPGAPRARPRRHQEPPLRRRGGFTRPPAPPRMLPSQAEMQWLHVRQARRRGASHAARARGGGAGLRASRAGWRGAEVRAAPSAKRGRDVSSQYGGGTRRVQLVRERRCARHAAGVQGAARVG
jgi:hypothetical protein